MKTRYKYIHFDDVQDCGWYCYNNRNDDSLGCVTFYPIWKQWVIDFRPDMVFNNQCLRDIADFLDQLNKKPTRHKAKGKGEK